MLADSGPGPGCGHGSAASKRTKEPSGHGGILPEGAFTLVLKIRFKPDLRKSDVKSLLSEYGRATCAEPHVLRCDILYEIDRQNRPRSAFYEIWTTFQDAQAYMDHERTQHATKLRVYLENPTGGDNAVLFTKLSFSVSLLRPIRPDVSAWRSSLDVELLQRPPPAPPSTRPYFMPVPPAPPSPQPPRVDDPNINHKRRALDRLISSVGLEDVKILTAAATAPSLDDVRALKTHCETYLASLDDNPGIVRTGLLIDRNDPFTVVMLTVHDAADRDGATFDLDFASDHISDAGWTVRRLCAVFPDKIGWERYVDEDEAARMGLLESPPTKPPPPPAEEVTSIQETTPPEPTGPRFRLAHGDTAFNNLKQYIRDLAGRPDGDLKVMFVNGWNEGRLHGVLHQLDYDRNTDPGRIHCKFGLSILSCEVTTANLLRGISFLRDFAPHVILGYGGGSAMDMAKALARVANCSSEELDAIVASIDEAADARAAQVVVDVTARPLPLLLVPNNAGPGAELTESVVFARETGPGQRWKRLPVYFADTRAGLHAEVSRTIVSDSRLLAGRRLDGSDAASGGLMQTCLALDVLLSLTGTGDTGRRLALDALGTAYRNIIRALREPIHSSGVSRDGLCKARTELGMALDSVGRLGVCVRISLAVIDELVDGRSAHVFRIVMTRVTAAIVDELCSDELDAVVGTTLREASRMMNVFGKTDVCNQILRRADDCDVPLLRRVGMVRRLNSQVAAEVAHNLRELPELSDVERLFCDPARVERVLDAAIEQDFIL